MKEPTKKTRQCPSFFFLQTFCCSFSWETKQRSAWTWSGTTMTTTRRRSRRTLHLLFAKNATNIVRGGTCHKEKLLFGEYLRESCWCNTPIYNKTILGTKRHPAGIFFVGRFSVRLSESDHSRVMFMASFFCARSN